MLKKLLLVALVVFSLSVASAATVTCDYLGAGSITFPPDQIQCGPLLFDNFAVVDAAGGARTYVTSPTGTWDDVNNIAYVSFNPGLFADQDQWLYFRVSGAPINGVDLQLSGVNASVTEVVCSAPIPQAPPGLNNCPAGTDLARFANTSGAPNVWMNFANPDGADPIWIYKNILVGPGGELSSMTQSFHVVPEPATFALLGGGLVAFALYRRRRA